MARSTSGSSKLERRLVALVSHNFGTGLLVVLAAVVIIGVASTGWPALETFPPQTGLLAILAGEPLLVAVIRLGVVIVCTTVGYVLVSSAVEGTLGVYWGRSDGPLWTRLARANEAVDAATARVAEVRERETARSVVRSRLQDYIWTYAVLRREPASPEVEAARSAALRRIVENLGGALAELHDGMWTLVYEATPAVSTPLLSTTLSGVVTLASGCAIGWTEPGRSLAVYVPGRDTEDVQFLRLLHLVIDLTPSSNPAEGHTEHATERRA